MFFTPSTPPSLDACIHAADIALRTLFAPARANRDFHTPTASTPPELKPDEKKAVARFMRVNHCGEVCAQALYAGQALGSSNPVLRQHLAQAAQEEMDHLAWTQNRLTQLGERASLLNPLWYAGAFALGLGAARMGDDWSLGFLKETERQVEAHLAEHLEQLPVHDSISKLLLQQMQREEAAHRQEAENLGARALPPVAQKIMRIGAKCMTQTSAFI